MRQNILKDFREHGFSYKTLHDHYAGLLDSLRNGDDFEQYHEVQTKLTGLHNMYKNGELPEPKSLTSDSVKVVESKEPVVVPVNSKPPKSLVPIPEDEDKKGPESVPLFGQEVK